MLSLKGVCENGHISIFELDKVPQKKTDVIITFIDADSSREFSRIREDYLRRIKNVSTWNEEEIEEIRKAQREISQWEIPT